MQGQKAIDAIYFILKGAKLMDWLNKMNATMDYIESDLANEIFYDKAAQIAYCSAYHFQRILHVFLRDRL